MEKGYIYKPSPVTGSGSSSGPLFPTVARKRLNRSQRLGRIQIVHGRRHDSGVLCFYLMFPKEKVTRGLVVDLYLYICQLSTIVYYHHTPQTFVSYPSLFYFINLTLIIRGINET